MKRQDAEQLFTLIEPFGGYGFNKPHAASYAVVAFYCAYLKANYTAEFMASTLTAVADDAKKIANAVVECKRLHVEVLGPDINKSERGFLVEDGAIRFGLLAIKGVGEGPISEIVRARLEGGPFSSFGDFCARVDPKYVGKGGIETLIKAGAMDALAEGKRHLLLGSVERAMQFGKSERAAKERGMISLFGEMQEIEIAIEFALNAKAEEISRKQLLAWEKELIGVYISNHPLAYLADLFKEEVTHNVVEITAELEKQRVVLGGTVKEIRRITTKKGDSMCIVQLEDISGSMSITVFPKLYETTAEVWREDAVVIVRGEVQIRNDEPLILCHSVSPLNAVEEEMNRKRYMLWLTIEPSGSDELSVSNDIIKVHEIYRCIHENPGRDHYEILVSTHEWTARLTPGDNTLCYSQDLHTSLEALLGKGLVEAQIVER